MNTTDQLSHVAYHRMVEDLLQDADANDIGLHKQSCRVDGDNAGAPDVLDLQQGGGELVHSGDNDEGRAADGVSEVAGAAVVARYGSAVSCCCGDNRGFNALDTQMDDMSGVMVARGGRFPCLHISLTGLRPSRRYFLALDFVEVGGAGEDGLSPYNYTEPYYAPRPNNLPGKEWMSSVLYFSLNSIANARPQEGGTTLEVGGEYEPTVRLLELRDDQWPSGSSAMRFPLRGTAFLVVSLSSEVRTSRTALANEFLLVRKSEMSSVYFNGSSATRSRCARQRQQQHPHEQDHPQDSFRRSPPSRGVFLEQSTTSSPTLRQPDWRRLLELRAASRQAAATATAGRLLHVGSGEPRSHSLQALPTAHEVLSTSGGHPLSSTYSKPAVPDHFSGGVWKSLPTQPAPQLPHQHSSAWHSSTVRHHGSLAPEAQLELGAAVLQGRQHGREPPSSAFTGLNGGARSGAEFPPPAEHRPALPPFCSAAAAARVLQDGWSRSTPHTTAAAPMLRFNYDLLPASYLQWLALARNSLTRPPTTTVASALDHDQQPQHRAKQDVGVLTACSTATAEEEPQPDTDETASSATHALSLSAPRPLLYFSPSAPGASSPP